MEAKADRTPQLLLAVLVLIPLLLAGIHILEGGKSAFLLSQPGGGLEHTANGTGVQLASRIDAPCPPLSCIPQVD